MLVAAYLASFTFWILARAWFDEDFRFRLRDAGIALALVLAYAASRPEEAALSRGRLLARSLVALLVAHALFRVYRGARSDLLRLRLRLRYAFLFVSGLYAPAVLLAETLVKGSPLAPLAETGNAFFLYPGGPTDRATPVAYQQGGVRSYRARSSSGRIASSRTSGGPVYHGSEMARNEDFNRRLRAALEQIPQVSVAVLFGSRATGRARADSDLDVAVLPAESAVSRRELQAEIAVALADLAPEGRVDVVFIDEAPELIRQRIMETGIVLLLRDEPAWRKWRVRTMREHGDREPVRRFLRRRQRERLLGGASGGRPGRAIESLERVGKLSN